jgi:hypothetical protein
MSIEGTRSGLLFRVGLGRKPRSISTGRGRSGFARRATAEATVLHGQRRTAKYLYGVKEIES